MIIFCGTCLSSDIPSLGPPWILIFQGCFSLPCASYVFLRIFIYHRAAKIAREMAQLLNRLGAMEWCMSRYIHSRGDIHERYMNRPKWHKLEGLVFVGESNRSLQRKGVEVLVYDFFHGDLVDVELFAS